ncbi:MAG: DivIVA domain-containing protein, partial [Clostridia bacterium]|nr:DivIVA domain-containing protein [Clostridia bacterium]
MAKFDIDKKGYNPEQVDEFIKALTLKYEEKLSEQKDRVFSMRNEVRVLQERVDMYQTKDKQISKALVYAVEKADQIEASARKLYELELKRISILYAKWQEIVTSIEEHYGNTNGVESVDALIEEFKEGLRSICEQNNKIASKSVVKTNPRERAGVFCKIDGKPGIIEYSELPEEMVEEVDENGELVFGDVN